MSNLRISPQRNDESFQSPKPIDYLKQMRQKREELEKMGIVRRREGFAEIEQIMESGLSQRERYDLISHRVRKLEQNTLRKEKLLKQQKGEFDEESLDVNEEINNMYVDCIKAKLALLDDI